MANLRPPWKSGGQANPHGEQGPKITPRIRHLLDMNAAEFDAWRPRTVGDVIAYNYVFEAMAGSQISERGRQEVIERVDGKVVEKREVETTKKIETVYVDGPRPQLRVVE